MNLFLLYLLMLKATLTSFNGPMSLPVLRNELVVQRHVITDRELNAAVTTAQSAPGPMGIYVVSVGFFVAGFPGALAGYLAVLTPAFAMVPIVRYAGNRMNNRRVRSMFASTVSASAGLVFTSAGPLARASITNWFSAAIAIAALVLLVRTRLDTVWIIAGAGVFSLTVALLAGTA